MGPSQVDAGASPLGEKSRANHARRLARLPVSTLAIALVLTSLNVAKPLVVDDASYTRYARQIAQDPTDPYGFEHFWYDEPGPANRIVAPPAFLYYLAAAQRLFGESPVAWKLSLFPFALLLCVSLRRLLDRFAPGAGAWGLGLVVLSPAILPSFNLMLDVPSLALGLTAFAAGMTACDRERGVTLAVAAGLLAGVAMQTKYTAVVPLTAWLAYSVLTRRLALGLLAGLAASAVFIGWEAFTFFRYGESHFLNGILYFEDFSGASLPQTLLAYLDILGAASPVAVLLALQVLRARPAWLLGAGAGLTLAFVAIARLPAPPLAIIGHTYPPAYPAELEQLVLSLLGLLVVATTGWVLVTWSWRRLRGVGGLAGTDAQKRRLDVLIVVWLVLEVGGLFVLSPCPAIRRAIGVHVVLVITLLRVTCTADRAPETPRALPWIAAWGAALGLLFAVTDLGDARTRHRAIGEALAALEANGAGRDGETVWYVGHWGVQYYAEAAGLRAIVPGESRLEKGDWLLWPYGVYTQAVVPPTEGVLELTRFSAVSAWPWSTMPGIYAGYRPLRPQPEFQLVVVLSRVQESFVPARPGDAP